MFAIDEAKLPPPTPVIAARIIRVVYDTPGLIRIAAGIVGRSSRAALMIVQFRPPNVATANVYGSRSAEPTSAGTAVSRNFPAASTWYAGPRNNTMTDHIVHTEKPMCSEKMEKTRLRRATRAPRPAQNAGSSGRQSSIHRPGRAGTTSVGRKVSTAVLMPAPRSCRGVAAPLRRTSRPGHRCERVLAGRKHEGRHGETAPRHASGMPEVATHCPYCALQCGMTLRLTGTGRVEVGTRDFPTNRGGLCQKGWTAAELLDHPDRLTTPLLHGEPVSWPVALDFVATRIRELQATHGRDAVAVFGGGGLTNEKGYALGKFARVVLGTRYVDYNGRFCMSSAAAAGIRAFGIDRGLPFPLSDLGKADTLLLAGANVAETMPPLGRYLTEQTEAGGTLIVIDPRATPTARRAGLHLQPTPGTDLAVALGLLHVVIAEGYVDRGYVAARTTGWAEVARRAAAWWPARVERLSGVPAADLEA